jgi:DedD protein
MNDHNLDDLIIDTIAPKNGKSKSFLTIIALLLVVLIVAIILTKTLLKAPQNNDLTFEENLTTMIAPELQLEEPTKVKEPIKVVENLSISKNLPKTTIKKPEIKKPEITYEVTPSNVNDSIKKPTTEVAVVSKPTAKPEVTKIATKKSTVTKNSNKKPVQKKFIAKKHVTKKPVRKANTSSAKKYYVQVGSFKEKPSARFLSVIKSSGFKYHITNVDARGYRKLLIGPYKTRASVDKARDMVRDRIHKSAFVVQK